jgi:hypothetical protein
MSDVRPREGEPGYRGALPPRNDWLARGWVLVVIGIFFLIFILAALNVPTVLLPAPTPSAAPSATAAPSGSGSAAPSSTAAPAGSPSPSP